ncbi:glycosyl hydrolase family 5 [Planosporangium flavigriseum]|uniref:Endoglucanase n=1 Tax=Planosporangium flavigriseum TaxID=373681 RepID=A0A8J3LM34_9ACTN|nr:glycoside hydrolase family 9 protein [Planosporangium flavigriseum]NJC67613.1 glycosyl hydrolase family 5 [Planosporangium flavigriseum]GIG75683.1 endoglucanase [Planosporangium flavigriseum]
MRTAVTAATALTATGLLAIAPGATAFAAEPANSSGLSANVQPGAVPEMYKSGTGPRVRVNQVGYLTNGPKNATFTTGAEKGLPWQLKDAKGKVVASGTTTPQGPDAASAHSVHTIDFSKYATPGKGYKLVVDGETSHPFAIGDKLYDNLRQDALRFYYTQRSGIAIDDKLRPGYGRPAGHVSQGETGDLAVGCVNNGCDYKLNVKGGWYDAGDQGKYVVNGGISAFQLMNQFERSKTAKTAQAAKMGDGTLAIPESKNKVPDILDEARWEQEFLLSMQVPDGKQNAGMAHHKMHDESWTALPTLPHQDTKKRVLYPPSTAATLNLAATGAQAARVFTPYDKKFAEKNLAAAKKAWAAAKANPNMAASGDSGSGGGGYGDWSTQDEFYWAAAELYLTTGDKEYADYLQNSPLHKDAIWSDTGFDWGNVAQLGRLDLATVPSKLADRDRVRKSVVEGADKYLAMVQKNPWGMPYAVSDRYNWGSNAQILNNMVVLATGFDITGDVKYRDAVLQGMDYILGRNVLNRSYVTGFGTSYSVNQHSRWYAKQLDKKLPPPPVGTLAGGPNSGNEDDLAKKQLAGCVGQYCYLDDIMAFASNELTINWNAPLAWVTAFVADQKGASAPADQR